MIYLFALLIGAIFGLSCMIPWMMPLAFIAQAPFIAHLIKKCESGAKTRKIYFLGFVNAVGFFFRPEITWNVPTLVIFPLLLGIYFGAKKLWKKKLSSIWLICISAGLGIVVCSVMEYL